jgi:hypothetical protein
MGRARLRHAAVAVVVAVLTAGCGQSLPTSVGSSSAGTGTAGLVVAAESHAGSYARKEFGQRWKDIDRNGCGQRDDVLARDLRDTRRQGRCVVVAGTLTDPYTGVRVSFVKARAEQVQIDHVVALAEAWRSGAWAWTLQRREAFANDLAVLQASAGPVNQAKSDHDPGTWRPSDPARACTWARQVVRIKIRWGLSADRQEADALAAILTACPR